MKRVFGSFVFVLVIFGCNETFRFDEPAPGATDDAGDAGSGDAADATDAGSRCTTDPVCGSGLRCNQTTGRCVACLGDSDCASPSGRCRQTDHVCVACLNGPDCGKRQACDTVTNRCLDVCIDEDDCLSAGFICDRDRALCIECKTAANCAGAAGGSQCNATIGRCVECIGDADCQSSKGICDRRSGRCVECVVSDSCADGRVCDPSLLACRNGAAP